MIYSEEQHQCCFSFLSHRQAVTFFEFLEEKRLVAGDELQLHDAGLGTLYFIVSGTFDVHYQGPQKGPTPLLARMVRGSFVGEGALVGSGSRNTTITSVNDSQVLGLSSKSFDRYLMEQPETAILILKKIVAVLNLRLSSCSSRVASIL